MHSPVPALTVRFCPGADQVPAAALAYITTTITSLLVQHGEHNALVYEVGQGVSGLVDFFSKRNYSDIDTFCSRECSSLLGNAATWVRLHCLLINNNAAATGRHYMANPFTVASAHHCYTLSAASRGDLSESIPRAQVTLAALSLVQRLQVSWLK